MQKPYGWCFRALMFMVLTASTSSAQLVFDTPPSDNNAAIKGKPYEASKAMHTRRILADGTVSTHDVQIREARDSNGRFLQEVQMEIPTGSGRPPLVMLTVRDPEAGTLLTWTSIGKVSTLTHLQPIVTGLHILGPGKGPEKIQPAVPIPKTEIIGHRMIHGMLATGHRTVRTIAVGTIGNSEPTVAKREWWTDDDLHITVLETGSNPQSGEHTTELIEIKRGEPDPARFHVPAGYVVRESNKPTVPAGIASLSPALDLANAPLLSHAEALVKLASGNTQEQSLGAAVLVKEAQSSEDASIKDDVAYSLARANVGLPEALQLAEAAVFSAEAESAASSDHGRAKPGDFNRDIALSKYWHTLGYVHSRLGEPNIAKQYIQRAWELDSLAYYGSHLARLFEEAGDTRQAIRIYSEALNSNGGEDLKKTLRERLQALTGSPNPLPTSGNTPLAGATVAGEGTAFFDFVYAAGQQSPSAVFVSGAGALKPLLPILTKAEENTFALPDSGPEKVVRRVEVTCKAPSAGAEPACQAQPLSAHQARSLVRQNLTPFTIDEPH